MTLKTVKRITLSLPKSTIQKLEQNVPKSKRSKFVAEALEKQLFNKTQEVTFEEVSNFWDTLAHKYPLKEPLDKTSEELIREDRMSH